MWLIHGWYKQNWWKTKAAKTDTESCTDQQVEALLKRSIAILQIPTAENVTATTNVELVRSWIHTCINKYDNLLKWQTAEEFREQYEERLGNNPSEPSAALSYDAVWTLAKALDRYVYIFYPLIDLPYYILYMHGFVKLYDHQLNYCNCLYRGSPILHSCVQVCCS